MTLPRDLALDLVGRHPEEAAAVLEALGPEESSAFLAGLPPESAARVLRHMTAQRASAVLAELESEVASDIAVHLPVDVAAGYMRRLGAEDHERILARVPGGRARALRALLRFREDTAGSLMDPEVLALPVDVSVREAVERIRKSAGNARYNVYVVDREDHLLGVLNLRELLLARPQTLLSDIMHRDVIHIFAETDRHAIIDHPGWRAVHALPVVDGSGIYLGAIRYKTMRRLEDERRSTGPDRGLAAEALGDLFWVGLSGVVEAVTSGAATRPASGGSEHGDV